MSKYKVAFNYHDNVYVAESESYEPTSNVPEQKYCDIVAMDVVCCLNSERIQLPNHFVISNVTLTKDGVLFRDWKRFNVKIEGAKI